MALAAHRTTAAPRAGAGTARPLRASAMVLQPPRMLRGGPVRYTSASGRVGEGGQEEQPLKDAASHKASTEKYSSGAEGLDPSGRQVDEEHEPG